MFFIHFFHSVPGLRHLSSWSFRESFNLVCSLCDKLCLFTPFIQSHSLFRGWSATAKLWPCVSHLYQHLDCNKQTLASSRSILHQAHSQPIDEYSAGQLTGPCWVLTLLIRQSWIIDDVWLCAIVGPPSLDLAQSTVNVNTQ